MKLHHSGMLGWNLQLDWTWSSASLELLSLAHARIWFIVEAFSYRNLVHFEPLYTLIQFKFRFTLQILLQLTFRSTSQFQFSSKIKFHFLIVTRFSIYFAISLPIKNLFYFRSKFCFKFSSHRRPKPRLVAQSPAPACNNLNNRILIRKMFGYMMPKKSAIPLLSSAISPRLGSFLKRAFCFTFTDLSLEETLLAAVFWLNLKPTSKFRFILKNIFFFVLQEKIEFATKYEMSKLHTSFT